MRQKRSNKSHGFTSSIVSINLKRGNMSVNSCTNDQDPTKKEGSSTTEKRNCVVKNTSYVISRDVKSKYGQPNKYSNIKVQKQHPLFRRRSASVSNQLTNASAKVVLFERNVEIKDLESKVKYLQNKMKELQNENKTLVSVQSRQERELKHFKEGVADIPSLLRSHKEEVKAYESTISNIRRELKDCQKELKLRNEGILKKDSQIDKLNVLIKRNEKDIHDMSLEVKEYKMVKKDLEEENKMLVGANRHLKSENEGLHKKIEEMCSQIKNLESNVSKEINLNKQLKDDLKSLEDKYKDEKLKISHLVAKKFETSGLKDESLSKNPSGSVINEKLENLPEDENKEPYSSLIESKHNKEHLKNSPGDESRKLANSLENECIKLENSFNDGDKNEEDLCQKARILENLARNNDKKIEKIHEREIQNSLVEILHGKALPHGQSPDRSKDDLTFNFNCYEDLCNTKVGSSSSCSRLFYGIKASNLRALPPLKQSCQKCVRDPDSAGTNKGYFGSNTNLRCEKNLAGEVSYSGGKKISTDMNTREDDTNLKSKKFAEESHCRLKMSDQEPKCKLSGFKEALEKDKFDYLSDFLKQDSSMSQAESYFYGHNSKF